MDEVEALQVRLRATDFVLAERERELLTLKGPCSTERCRLHYAHSGPCDIAPMNAVPRAAERVSDQDRASIREGFRRADEDTRRVRDGDW